MASLIQAWIVGGDAECVEISLVKDTLLLPVPVCSRFVRRMPLQQLGSYPDVSFAGGCRIVSARLIPSRERRVAFHGYPSRYIERRRQEIPALTRMGRDR